MFVTLGPLIWRVDPSHQNILLPSLGPSWNNIAIVLDGLPPWEDIIDSNQPAQPNENVDHLPAPTKISLLNDPTTLGVRLRWDPVPGANGYAIYRSEYLPRGENLGIPLEEISPGNKTGFEDLSALEVKKYFYSVVAKNLKDEEGIPSSPFEVQVQRVAPLDEAKLLDPDAKIGAFVKLAPVPAGTDALGRDILARLMFGGRVSLFIGFFASLAYVGLGILIGGFAGYAGGRIDYWLMRFTDFVTGLPFLLFMILLKVTLSEGPGASGVNTLILALVVLSWTGTARLVRGQILQLRESEYVQAARLLGASDRKSVV